MDAQLDNISPLEQLVTPSNGHKMGQDEHFVQFYETDDFLLHSLSDYISEGLEAGDACIVVATKAHREHLEQRLQVRGLDLATLHTCGQYIPLDAAETLSKFMLNGLPDPQLFSEVISKIIMHAAQGRQHVRIFGEMVALLWDQGNRPATIRLEALWNALRSETLPFTLFCAYPMHDFADEAYGVPFTKICQLHSHVIPDESYTALDSPDERLRVITLLQQKAKTLEAEIAKRDAFISMASHELKTPVTSLKGFIYLLQRRLSPQSDPQTRLFLDRMEVQLTKLTKLISDMLDLSKIQVGKLTYQEEQVDLDALVYDAVEQVQATTSTHHLQCVGHTHTQVSGDQDRLRQVFLNLLSNAVKYSPAADTVLITLAQDGKHALVSIRDFGIGIAEAHHQRIFERFYQVPDPLEKTFPGLGIGLYLSREIILRHQGRIWVESCKGEGSIFHVSLPAQQSVQQEGSVDSVDIEGKSA